MTCDGIACKASDLKSGMKIRVTTKKEDQDVATSIEAIDKHTLFANTFDGKFVSLVGNKLTMKDSAGKKQSHLVAADATMTCDRTICTAEALKEGMKIRVTTNPEDGDKVIHVEAIDQDPEFSQID